MNNFYGMLDFFIRRLYRSRLTEKCCVDESGSFVKTRENGWTTYSSENNDKEATIHQKLRNC